MKTGKVEYAPDYKSERRTLTIADIPDDLDDRLLFCDSSPTQERIADLQRLQAAVVEAVRVWAKLRDDRNTAQVHESATLLLRTHNALIAFEAEHKIGERDERNVT
jgi:hypothetical protein